MRFVAGTITVDQFLAFVFGVFFCAVLLIYSALIPEPTAFALFVARVILSLAAAGVGAVLPGLLHVQFPGVRATGALALAAIVFFANPPALIRDSIEKKVGLQFQQIYGLISRDNIELATELLNKARVIEPEPVDLPFSEAS